MKYLFGVIKSIQSFNWHWVEYGEYMNAYQAGKTSNEKIVATNKALIKQIKRNVFTFFS